MKYSTSCLLIPLLQVTPTVADYAGNAVSAVTSLQNKWYNAGTGRWNDLWWQSGNMATTIAHLGSVDSSFKQTATDILSNTYAKAPATNNNGWTNDFYDDEGWWTHAWIATYDLTGDTKYLDTAKSIFEDMTGGWNTPCNGGIWWDKKKSYVNAIANELFISAAAHLANRVSSSDKQNYVHWAQMGWDWFSKTGIINGDHTINDGLDSTCKNNGQTVFTYNQGVILGGLAELARATGNNDYINSAKSIADAAISKLAVNGILTESGGIDEDTTLAQFKGVFVRNLAILDKQANTQSYTNFLHTNADTLWSNDKDGSGLLGPHWQGPVQDVTAPSHASGLDALVAAAQT